MLSRRTAAILFGGCLAFGGVAASAGSAFAVDTPPTTAAPANAAPAPFTLTIPGVGTLSLTVDPATGVVSDVLVTPVDGMTAGTPEITAEGVKIVFTAANGTVHVLEAEVKRGDGGLHIESEVDTEDGEQHQDGVQGTSHESDHTGSNDHVNDHPHDAVSTHDGSSDHSHDSSPKPPEQKVENHGDESHSSHGSDGQGSGDHGHDATPTSAPASDDSHS
jgi:hypothetical protein